MLVHVIDCATLEPNRDPLSDLDALEAELHAYGSLENRPRLVALNKVDAVDAKTATKLARKLEKLSGVEVMPLSGAAGTGLDAVLDKLVALMGPAPERTVAPADDDASEAPGEWYPL